jgi:signal transduction histidine kinase
VDLGALLTSTCKRYQLHNQLRQSLVLSVEPAQPILADSELLTRLVENLLDNAVQYAPAGTPILVSARLREDGTGIELRVSDEGCGIAPEHRERVFEKYAQLGNAREDEVHAGRGLGLTFCRMIAEAHGGRIFIEDNHPQGSVFCVELPLRAIPD